MYHHSMIKKAKDLSRYQRKKLQSSVRGIYQDGNEDLFDMYLLRYQTGVVTLTTALSFYGLIDNWLLPPYDFCFQYGYRNITDKNINQYRDDKKNMLLGVARKKHNDIEFNIYDKERLLIELWRKEKYIPLDIYKQAIFSYRQLANNGELNIPLLKEYISKMPKFNIYYKRLSLEVL